MVIRRQGNIFMQRSCICLIIVLQSHRHPVGHQLACWYLGSDNTPRFCSDIHKVNDVTKPDSLPLPCMEDCVDQMGSAKFISRFDLLKGYWQVPLSKRVREVAAFIMPTDWE